MLVADITKSGEALPVDVFLVLENTHTSMWYPPTFILMEPNGRILDLVIRLESIDEDGIFRRDLYSTVNRVQALRIVLRFMPVERSPIFSNGILDELTKNLRETST